MGRKVGKGCSNKQRKEKKEIKKKPQEKETPGNLPKNKQGKEDGQLNDSPETEEVLLSQETHGDETPVEDDLSMKDVEEDEEGDDLSEKKPPRENGTPPGNMSPVLETPAVQKPNAPVSSQQVSLPLEPHSLGTNIPAQVTYNDPITGKQVIKLVTTCVNPSGQLQMLSQHSSQQKQGAGTSTIANQVTAMDMDDRPKRKRREEDGNEEEEDGGGGEKRDNACEFQNAERSMARDSGGI